ncbi:hypothetical protein Dimus_026254 [Dionaea muscipula]
MNIALGDEISHLCKSCYAPSNIHRLDGNLRLSGFFSRIEGGYSAWEKRITKLQITGRSPEKIVFGGRIERDTFAEQICSGPSSVYSISVMDRTFMVVVPPVFVACEVFRAGVDLEDLLK